MARRRSGAVTGIASAPATASLGAAVRRRAQRVLPGGVNSPVRAFAASGGPPASSPGAKGAWLVDVDGNRYVDLVLSWGPLILGHAHPGVLAAIGDGRGTGHHLRRPHRARGAAGRAGDRRPSRRSRWCAS